jgi:hypothetical protein
LPRAGAQEITARRQQELIFSCVAFQAIKRRFCIAPSKADADSRPVAANFIAALMRESNFTYKSLSA